MMMLKKSFDDTDCKTANIIIIYLTFQIIIRLYFDTNKDDYQNIPVATEKS